ncbi:hypothetical protein FBUS_08644, partial [Fasciolopsis buskii]
QESPVADSETKPSTPAIPVLQPNLSSIAQSSVATSPSSCFTSPEQFVQPVTMSLPGAKCAREDVSESLTSTTSHTEFRANNTVRITPWSWPIRSQLDSHNDVSPEDRLYGVWRHLIPRLLSDQIFVWAHQQGGHALVHPLKPMPGLWPGFPDDSPVTLTHKPMVIPASDTVERRGTFTEHSNQTPDSNSTTQSERSILSRSRGPVNTTTLSGTCVASSSPVPRETASKGSCVKQVQTKPSINSVSANSGLGSQAIHRTSTGSIRPRVYPTRKRHVSANAILSTCPTTTKPSSHGVHRTSLLPVGEHNQEVSKSVAGQNTTTKSEPAGTPGSVDVQMKYLTSTTATTVSKSTPKTISATGTECCTTCMDAAPMVQTMEKGPGQSKSVCTKTETDQNLPAPVCLNPSVTCSESGGEMFDTCSANPVTLNSGCKNANTNTPSVTATSTHTTGAHSFTRLAEPLIRQFGLSDNGGQLKGTDAYSGLSSDNNTSAGDILGSNEDEEADSSIGLQLRLARAWQQKARRLFDELTTRVKCVVFTDCPTILDLAMEGIGWGLNLLQDVSDDNDNSNPQLFKPSLIRSDIPDRVRRAREWFCQNAVHFVAADTPIGTQLDEGARRRHPIPVLSAGTTEHDLIPSSVLETVFDLFNSKLNPRNKSDLTIPSSRTVGTDNPEELSMNTDRCGQSASVSHTPPI